MAAEAIDLFSALRRTEDAEAHYTFTWVSGCRILYIFRKWKWFVFLVSFIGLIFVKILWSCEFWLNEIEYLVLDGISLYIYL